jgi:tRNA A-37 threonylcarbamoyl transferase component Bud32
MLIENFELHRSPDVPDFSDLPWNLPLDEWKDRVSLLENVQQGISRHPVVFLNLDNKLFAIKELPEKSAQKEFFILSHLYEMGLPTVQPAGYAFFQRDSIQFSALFTYYLEASLPYRSLFINKVMEQYQDHLLDAISGVLVQLHLNGFYWGDCSLSNILFRRDAGTLQAYLVDAETAEYHLPPLSPMLRFHDLEIMEENIYGELTDLQVSNHLSFNYPIDKTGKYIQNAYRNLWDEITREDVFGPSELFRVEERVRALNSLGFSVKDIELRKEDHGNILKLRIFVSDRNFHRNHLAELTGIHAEDRQAQQMLNEITELKAKSSQESQINQSLADAAMNWMENIYRPITEKLQVLIDANTSPETKYDLVELYCQILEHKWYLSERAKHDVGHQFTVDDFIMQFS